MEISSFIDPTSRHYFAAMNTASGFCGKFREIFGSLEKLYIIKGGPGTGKSRLIRELGAEAERNGRDVEYFLCSSDPTSLDGVIFTARNSKERIGIIDGTSPHSYEPRLPGATENIIDLGAFWNADALAGHKAELIRLNAAKAQVYASVYGYLSAIHELDTVAERTSAAALMNEKLDSAVKRLLRTLPLGSGYCETVRIRSAISSIGTVKLDTFSRLASHNYAVTDRAFTANAFMRRLKKELKLKEQRVIVSYDPFFPDTPDAICIPTLDATFYVGCEGNAHEKLVNMTRFVSSDALSAHKTALRAIYRSRRELLALTYSEYSRIAELHGELEAYYTGAMDFSRANALCDDLKKALFS